MRIRIALVAAGVAALVTTAAASPALASTTVGPVQTVPAAQILFGVACSSPTTCVAVGFTPDTQQGVVVPITNGVTGPAQVVPGTGFLQGVACSSATSCVAVGGSVVLPITNGVAGAPQVVPGAFTLNGVACSSPGSCVAVGYNTVVPIVNGVAGAVQQIQDVSGVQLNGVACPGGPICYAVGTAPDPNGGFSDLALLVPIVSGTPGTPQTVAGSTGFFTIGCPSATTCQAVGNGDFAAGFFGPVIVPIVNGAPGSPNALPFELGQGLGLGCASAATCEVVGFSDTARLVSVVNGTPGPAQQVPGVTGLYGVACATPTTCFAVGGTGTYPEPYVGVVVTLTVKADETSLTCTAGTSAGGVSGDICKVTDPDGLRSVVVKNATTGQVQTSMGYNCAKAPTSARFRVPGGTGYKVVVTDCHSPGNRTIFAVGADGSVTQV